VTERSTDPEGGRDTDRVADDVTAGAQSGQDPERMQDFARRLEEPPPPGDEEWEVTRADTGTTEHMDGEAPTS
jgi:hypothetical protein